MVYEFTFVSHITSRCTVYAASTRVEGVVLGNMIESLNVAAYVRWSHNL